MASVRITPKRWLQPQSIQFSVSDEMPQTRTSDKRPSSLVRDAAGLGPHLRTTAIDQDSQLPQTEIWGWVILRDGGVCLMHCRMSGRLPTCVSRSFSPHTTHLQITGLGNPDTFVILKAA